MSIRHLDRLLEPKSVVVVGASDRVGSVGATVWRNLRAGRFAGPIHAVNPKHATIEGVAVFAHLAVLPQAPDLADRKSTRLNSSHVLRSRMPSSA